MTKSAIASVMFDVRLTCVGCATRASTFTVVARSACLARLGNSGLLIANVTSHQQPLSLQLPLFHYQLTWLANVVRHRFLLLPSFFSPSFSQAYSLPRQLSQVSAEWPRPSWMSFPKATSFPSCVLRLHFVPLFPFLLSLIFLYLLVVYVARRLVENMNAIGQAKSFSIECSAMRRMNHTQRVYKQNTCPPSRVIPNLYWMSFF